MEWIGGGDRLKLQGKYDWLARLINRFVILRAIHRWMKAMDFSSPIIWTFLPTALARDLIRELNPRLVIYYCIDNFAQSSRFARKISTTEQQIIAEADLVFVTSHQLHKYASAHNSEVFFFPFGVSLEKFEQAREDGFRACPKDIVEVAKPVVASAVGVNAEIIEDGVTGFLVRSEDEWVEKLSLLIGDIPLRQKLGRAGRQLVEERFSLRANEEKFLAAIESAVNGQRAKS